MCIVALKCLTVVWRSWVIFLKTIFSFKLNWVHFVQTDILLFLRDGNTILKIPPVKFFEENRLPDWKPQPEYPSDETWPTRFNECNKKWLRYLSNPKLPRKSSIMSAWIQRIFGRWMWNISWPLISPLPRVEQYFYLFSLLTSLLKNLQTNWFGKKKIKFHLSYLFFKSWQRNVNRNE